MSFSKKIDLSRLPDISNLRLERLNPLMLMATGGILIVVLVMLLTTGGSNQEQNNIALSQAKQSMDNVSDVVQNLRRALKDEQVQQLAATAASDPEKLADLQQSIGARIPGLLDVRLFKNNLNELRAEELGPFGFIVLDMLLTAAESGETPVQLHGCG